MSGIPSVPQCDPGMYMFLTSLKRNAETSSTTTVEATSTETALLDLDGGSATVTSAELTIHVDGGAA